MNLSLFLKKLTSTLKEISISPKNIEILRLKNLFIYNIYNETQSDIISYNISTGISDTEETSFMKAWSEYVERCSLNKYAQNIIKNKVSSTGFAAFPIFNDISASKIIAREKAYSEALERYVWVNWWDNNTRSRIENFNYKDNISFSAIIDKLNENIKIKNIFRVIPVIESNHSVILLFAELESGGYISGGACGLSQLEENTTYRALAELFRHGLGYSRYLKNNLNPKTFYEKRLIYFASGKGNNLVSSRLKKQGKEIIKTPLLIIDEEVESIAPGQYIVHRCLFSNQPEFTSGVLEKLCL